MLRRIDSSKRLSDLLVQISTASARLRGLPLLIGTAILLLSLISFGLVLLSLVLSDIIASAWLWLCLPLGFLHLALLVFFVGVMIAVPLGEGYRDTEQ